MSTVVFTDVEGAVRAWLRQHPLVSGETGGRVLFGMPEGERAFPLITLQRIGGGPQRGLAPLEDARLSLSCWGKSKKSAMSTTRAVTQASFHLDSEALDAEVFGYWANVDSVLWLPEPETQTPRYIVDITVTVRAV